MSKMSHEMFLDWFRWSLEEERRSMDCRHQLLVEDMKLKLEAVCPLQGNGGDSVMEEVGPLGSAGEAPRDNVPVEAKYLSQITPKDIGSMDAAAGEPKEQASKDTTLNEADSSSHRGTKLVAHQAHESHNIIQEIVFSQRFEWTFGLFIIVHICVMCTESQYIGLGIGHELGYPNYDQPRTEVWPAGEKFFFVVDFIFGTLYTIELVLKIVALRVQFVEAWNLLDFAIVFLWYFDKVTADVKLPIDTMLLRLLRLAKLLRLVKVLKSLTGFDQLFLMLTALRGSFRILCWVTCILFTCLIAFSLLSNQLLVANILEKEEVSLETRRRCFQYFGTFSRALFSMFEMTLGNWTVVGRFLLDDVHEIAGMTTMIYKLTMGFTVIAVINACFIKETFKIAEHDDLLMVMQKDQERRMHAAKMLKLLDMADTEGDGTLTKEEFVVVCQNPEVDKWLGAQGLRVTDAGAIFDLIDTTGRGVVHKEELVAGARSLQGMSRSLDVAKNHLALTTMQAELHQILHDLHCQFQEHTDVVRSQCPQPSSAGSTEMPVDLSGVQGIKEFKQELSMVMGEIREELKNMRSTTIQSRNTHMRPPLSQAPTVQDSSSQKVLWGCS